jgi:hypothetical protein
MKLKELQPLLDSKRDATFVSLRKEARSEDLPTLKNQSGLPHFGSELNDFSDAATTGSHSIL